MRHAGPFRLFATRRVVNKISLQFFRYVLLRKNVATNEKLSSFIRMIVRQTKVYYNCSEQKLDYGLGIYFLWLTPRGN